MASCRSLLVLLALAALQPPHASAHAPCLEDVEALVPPDACPTRPAPPPRLCAAEPCHAPLPPERPDAVWVSQSLGPVEMCLTLVLADEPGASLDLTRPCGAPPT